MATEADITLRGPSAYDLAQRALTEMQAANVWPTPLNYELWLHALTEPEGALAQELRRMQGVGEPLTEDVADRLAGEHIARARLNESIHDAGRVLDRELASVADAVRNAHRRQASYGQALDNAAARFGAADAPGELQTIVDGLANATRSVQIENATLERQLDISNCEVARLREHLEQMRRDASTDALTSLANRKAFDEHLDAAVVEAENGGYRLGLALLDVDHFKRFNDTWGHQTGDQVLRYVASVMSRACPAPRIAARYGGEEFALIFPRESSPQVQAALENIRQEIASRALRRRSTDDDLGAVTLSCGFAERRPGEDAVSLLERADAALYASKHTGRNRLTCADRLDAAA